ncbi:MAG: class I SAM-dependent methyltransferase [Rhodospirillales bacterium]|jgi:NADH dehydrogenase [ubiquinone] 1 alpha subcomplex assembly factor 7|nr:class I SAM-dependent methyltransferase [Rhodospirillales bacterium]
MNTLGGLMMRRIAQHGPINVAHFMAEALNHPRHGYYANRDPLGVAGDYVTAPEISQVFGELIGLWCAVTWQTMGCPDPVILVEPGPGRGTLMADALRATRSVPGFCDAVSLHLIETNQALRSQQRSIVENAGLARPAAWHDDLSGIPEGPVLLIANEFLDVLPVRQFQKTQDGWSERLVGLSQDGSNLRFVLSPPSERPALLDESLNDAPTGSVAEVSPAALSMAHTLGARLKDRGGAALFIDYGYWPSQTGETLQAVRSHQYRGVLDAPGEADLTTHVDFAAFLRSGTQTGARGFGPLEQGEFLQQLGLQARAQSLKASATPKQAAIIDAGVTRLSDPNQMGTLFKAIVLQNSDLPNPPGFD